MGRSGPCRPVVWVPEAARLAVVLPAVVFKGPGQGFRLPGAFVDADEEAVAHVAAYAAARPPSTSTLGAAGA
jgi:hypothetical protein